MKKILLLSLVAASFAACKKTDPNAPTITYNVAFGAWSTQPSNFTVTTIINNDTTVLTTSANYRDEIYGVEEDEPYCLRVTNNAGMCTIGAEVVIQKCIDGQCGDFYPVSQKNSTSLSIITEGEVQDPEG